MLCMEPKPARTPPSAFPFLRLTCQRAPYGRNSHRVRLSGFPDHHRQCDTLPGLPLRASRLDREVILPKCVATASSSAQEALLKVPPRGVNAFFKFSSPSSPEGRQPDDAAHKKFCSWVGASAPLPPLEQQRAACDGCSVPRWPPLGPDIARAARLASCYGHGIATRTGQDGGEWGRGPRGTLA